MTRANSAAPSIRALYSDNNAFAIDSSFPKPVNRETSTSRVSRGSPQRIAATPPMMQKRQPCFHEKFVEFGGLLYQFYHMPRLAKRRCCSTSPEVRRGSAWSKAARKASDIDATKSATVVR